MSRVEELNQYIQELSYMGLFKHTDTYNYYIEYIKPKINVKKLKRILFRQRNRVQERGLQRVQDHRGSNESSSKGREPCCVG